MSNILLAVRSSGPIIHNLTSMVSANFQANALLAVGASPIMASEPEELAEISKISDGVCVNMGTAVRVFGDSCIAAVKEGTKNGIHIVLDPVGVGVSDFRGTLFDKLISTGRITAIRCNVGELASICGIPWKTGGVDAGSGIIDVAEAVLFASKKYNTIVAVSGEVDYVSDGMRVEKITGGHVIMPQVTGTGCVLSSVLTACIAASGEDPFFSTCETMRAFKMAGQRASEGIGGPGLFSNLLIDELFNMSGGRMQ